MTHHMLDVGLARDNPGLSPNGINDELTLLQQGETGSNKSILDVVHPLQHGVLIS
jgi:hypothetical protein